MRRVFNLIDAGATSGPTQATLAPSHYIEAVRATWAQALRCDTGRTRDAMLCGLTETVQELAHQYPEDAKVMLWNGIVLTGYAKSLGDCVHCSFRQKPKPRWNAPSCYHRTMALLTSIWAYFTTTRLVHPTVLGMKALPRACWNKA